jgi:regulator of protease activity HflC (stomatin/prohibitin superfamily)
MAKNIQTEVVIIKDTHRGLWYEDGKLLRVLEAGRYEKPKAPKYNPFNIFGRVPNVEIALVDMRERDLTIKGQEILTSDKVAIRVSIVVRFRVEDPRLAKHAVEDYEARLYTDAQLAARRSLASMKLEAILTNRNQLSEDILAEVTESAVGYGVTVIRADVKDLIFPGNLEQIMNRVLTAERLAEAQLIEARSQAEIKLVDAQARAEIQRIQATADNEAKQRTAEVEAEMARVATEAEIRDLKEREQAAQAYTQHPALLRLLELQTLRDLSHNASARIYVSFDRDVSAKDND